MAKAALPSTTHASRVKGERMIDVLIRVAKRDLASDWQRICDLSSLFAEGKTGENAARERIGLRYEYDLTPFATPFRRELYELSMTIDRLVDHFIAVELDHYNLFGFIGPNKFKIERSIKPQMFKLGSNRLEIDAQTIYEDVSLVEVTSEADDTETPLQQMEIVQKSPLRVTVETAAMPQIEQSAAMQETGTVRSNKDWYRWAAENVLPDRDLREYGAKKAYAAKLAARMKADAKANKSIKPRDAGTITARFNADSLWPKRNNQQTTK